MAKNLNVQNLDFDEIKENLIEFLKSQDKFKDYNFKGSGFDVILDLLAYNTHYMGFFSHMLANESFIDSAYLKSSLTSKAKLLNYIPRSVNSAIAEVEIYVNNLSEDPTGNKILLERGEIALASKSSSELSGDGRKFILIDDVYIYNKSKATGEYDYHSDVVNIYEGSFIEEKYKVDTSMLNQRFIIRSEAVDYRTIRIKVYPNDGAIGTDNFISYKLVNDFVLVDGNSNVFFLSVNEDSYYEISFGNGVYGREVEHGNVVEVSYVEANGELGNDAKYFFFNGSLPGDLVGTNVGATITTIANSDGGRDADTLEELRFNIPNHWRRQNRSVVVDDYKNILLSEYGNIGSLNVWGGEENYPKSYGTVFISIKPKFGDVLSSKAKTKIINNILKKYNVATVEPVIVDADFLYVNLENSTRYNPVKTDRNSGEIKSMIQDVIGNYNDDNVSKFDGYFSNSKMNTAITESDNSILSTFNFITLEKRFIPTLDTVQSYNIDFTNPIQPKTFTSDQFQFRTKRSYMYDDGLGNIMIDWWDDIDSVWTTYTDETFGEVNYDTGLISLGSLEIQKLYTPEDYLKTYTTPVNPDFFPVRNNIIRINEVEYTITEDYQNTAK